MAASAVSQRSHRWLANIWRDEHGGNLVTYAGMVMAVALMMLMIGATLNTRGNDVGGSLADVIECHVESFTGGGACGAAASPGAPGATDDRPWWERGWDWFSDTILSPIGDAIGTAWNWLWEERQATWWKDALDWLANTGWLGTIAAEVLGVLGDLLVGVDRNGNFSWGWVGISVITTVLSFFGVGLLGKIPVIGKLFKGGGIFARLGTWFAGTRFGAWLTKLGTSELIADFIRGKFGTIFRWISERGWLQALGSSRLAIVLRRFANWKPFARIPWLAAIDVPRTLGNYLWRLVVEGPAGLTQDIIKTLLKDVVARGILRGQGKIAEIILRIYQGKGFRDIFEHGPPLLRRIGEFLGIGP